MDNKTESLIIRLSEKELREIKTNANKSKLNVSEYVRKSSLNKQIVVIEDLKGFSKELHGIGNNLNQIVILAHQGKIRSINLPKIERLSSIISEIWDMLVSITKEG